MEINYFVALSNNTINNIMISNDGINWITRQFTGLNCTSICWSPDLSLFTIVANNGINRVYNSKIILSTYQNTITFNPKYFKYNEFTGNIALGENNTTSLTGTTQLSLTLDSATKPGTSTWTVSSDIRLKENIEDADLDLCYNNIKNLPLKRYKWKDEYITYENTSDRNKLGWIAQDVETILPKSVKITEQYGLTDCKVLNTDQIIAHMHGCVKKLLNIYENQNNKMNNLNQDIVLFQNHGLQNQSWTKRDCFILMGCDNDNFYYKDQINAALQLYKNNSNSIKFLNEFNSESFAVS